MSVTNLLVAAWTEWITKTNKACLDNPPKPEELLKYDGLRGDTALYTEFADRMIQAVYGETRYNPSSSTKLFEELIPPKARRHFPSSSTRMDMKIGYGCMTMLA